MFSSRLDWNLRPNRISTALEAKRHGGAPLLDLTESNPTHAGLDYPREEILSAFNDARGLTYAPLPAGFPEARQCVSDYYRARGSAVAPERVLITTSTSESYAYLFKLLADPGDEILSPRPSYPLFEFLAGLESVRIVQYPLAYHGSWSIDFDALERSITPRTRAVVLVNPNNPTGSYLKKDERARLAALCASHGIAILSDEVFSDYAFAPDANRVTTLVDTTEALTFCLSGLSKISGLPQVKLGWLVAGGPGATQAIERLELVADTYLSVSTPVQHAMPRLLVAGEQVQRQIAERTRDNLAVLRGAITSDSACQVLDVEGGWYAVLRVPRTRSEEEWALELLDKYNVLVQPGFYYDFLSEAYLVVSLLTAPTEFKEGIARVIGAVDRA